MVATTEEAKPVVAEIDSTQTSKVGETVPTPKLSPLETVQPFGDDNLDEERSDNELSPRANRDNDDAMKYGFGAGMRMYAKSLAMAEKQEASAPVKKLAPVRKVEPVIISTKPMSPKATLSPTAATPKAEPAPPVQSVASPKSEPAPTMEEVAISTPEPVAEVKKDVVVASPTTAMVVAAPTTTADEVTTTVPAKSIACGSIFSQINDFFGEFFRKTEDAVDDCHERVCNRDSATCASTAMKSVASGDDVADEMVESSKEIVKEDVVAKEEVATTSA